MHYSQSIGLKYCIIVTHRTVTEHTPTGSFLKKRQSISFDEDITVCSNFRDPPRGGDTFNESDGYLT